MNRHPHQVDSSSTSGQPHFLSADPLQNPAQPATPEKQLMMAVLLDAVICCKDSRTTATRKSITEATSWFESTDTHWPFSFENICETLGIDAGCLRRELSLPACSEAAASACGRRAHRGRKAR